LLRDMAAWRWTGLTALVRFGARAWAAGPGWYEAAPLALADAEAGGLGRWRGRVVTDSGGPEMKGGDTVITG
jgi:hypothetical protein